MTDQTDHPDRAIDRSAVSFRPYVCISAWALSSCKKTGCIL